MSGLTIADLTVRYGSVTAVDGVSVSMAEGSVFGLVGPSGCGKSTLLRCVAGLVTPASGSLSWNGVDVTSLPTHRRDIGLMFQDHALFSHRTVAQNIGFGLKMARTSAPDRARRVGELLELVGLEGFGRRSVESLSGGEAQRVALARALAPEPGLLLLDEPLASLDRARRIELNAELSRLLSELGQTSIYVTHDQDEAFAIADRVGVMQSGRLLRVGTPEEVWRDPQSAFVASFVGHEATVVRDGRLYAVRPDALSIVDDERQADVSGVVSASAFQGDRYEIEFQVEDQPWRCFSPRALPLGSSIFVTLDPARLSKLEVAR